MIDGTGTTTYIYDEVDRPTSVTSPGATTVGYRYDLDGNRIKLIYPDATAVTYAWNKASQMTSLLDWASRSVAYTYAADGLMQTATNPAASVTTYTYDNARRLVDILHSGPGGALIDRLAYTVDAAGNVTARANGSLALQFGRPDGLELQGGSADRPSSDAPPSSRAVGQTNAEGFPGTDTQQAVIVVVNLPRGERRVADLIGRLDTRLAAAAGKLPDAEYDRHEIATSEARFYIYGPDASQLAAGIVDAVSGLSFPAGSRACSVLVPRCPATEHRLRLMRCK